MDDLISRQLVITAFRSEPVDAHYPSWYENIVYNLPSAEPEVIRCKDCKHRIVNENYGKKGYMNLKAMCELDSGDPFELSRCAEDDDWFCADGKRS